MAKSTSALKLTVCGRRRSPRATGFAIFISLKGLGRSAFFAASATTETRSEWARLGVFGLLFGLGGSFFSLGSEVAAPAAMARRSIAVAVDELFGRTSSLSSSLASGADSDTRPENTADRRAQIWVGHAALRV